VFRFQLLVPEMKLQIKKISQNVVGMVAKAPVSSRNIQAGFSRRVVPKIFIKFEEFLFHWSGNTSMQLQQLLEVTKHETDTAGRRETAKLP